MITPCPTCNTPLVLDLTHSQQPMIDRAGAEGGWQDIASAPKDGSTIIATGPDYGRGPKRHIAVVYFDEQRDGFFDRAESQDRYAYLTHWCSVSIPSLADLPAPPSGDQQ